MASRISPAKRWWVMAGLRVVIVLLVVGGIARVVRDCRAEFQANPFSWNELSWGWIVVAAMLYFASLIPMGWFWFQLLRALGQPVGFYAVLRAYVIGHLGKYVPGKALVLVLRAGLLKSSGAEPRLTVVSIVLETFNMMAVGAVLAAGFLTFQLADHWWLQALMLGIAILLLAPLLPPVSSRLIGWVIRNKMVEPGAVTVESLPFRVVAGGWGAIAVGWLLMAASMMATIRGVVTVDAPVWSTGLMARCISSTTLSVVGGFLSLLPGGVGVREWIMDQFLVVPLGHVSAVVTVIFVRVIWLATEVLAAVGFYLVRAKV